MPDSPDHHFIHLFTQWCVLRIVSRAVAHSYVDYVCTALLGDP